MDETELKVAINELKIDLAKFNYVIARSDGCSVEESAKKAKRSKSWFYAMQKDEQDRLELLAAEINAAPKLRARQMLDDAVVEAAKIKISGLKSKHENIKQSAATEILDRTGFKPQSQVDITTGGKPLTWREFVELPDESN